MTTAPQAIQARSAGGRFTKARTVEERFWEKVDASGDCWEWTAACGGGYGRFSGPGRRLIPAHRFAWETLVGPVPEGHHLDHLCRNTRCVNPDHLRPVLPRENYLAGYSPSAMAARRTHCPRGHELAGENLGVGNRGTRLCLTCKRARDFNKYYTAKGRVPRKRGTCGKGHELTWYPASRRWRCKECNRLLQRAVADKKKAVRANLPMQQAEAVKVFIDHEAVAAWLGDSRVTMGGRWEEAAR